MSAAHERLRHARCACGAFVVAVHGAPAVVHACSCTACQRRSGSTFTHTAFFPETAVTVLTGDPRAWQRPGDSGLGVETSFCPVCGTTLLSRPLAWPGMVGVAAGCFDERDLGPPQRLYWAQSRQPWLALPADVELCPTQ